MLFVFHDDETENVSLGIGQSVRSGFISLDERRYNSSLRLRMLLTSCRAFASSDLDIPMLIGTIG